MQGSCNTTATMEVRVLRSAELCGFSPRLLISIFHGCMLLVFDADTWTV